MNSPVSLHCLIFVYLLCPPFVYAHAFVGIFFLLVSYRLWRGTETHRKMSVFEFSLKTGVNIFSFEPGSGDVCLQPQHSEGWRDRGELKSSLDSFLRPCLQTPKQTKAKKILFFFFFFFLDGGLYPGRSQWTVSSGFLKFFSLRQDLNKLPSSRSLIW